VEIGYNLGGPTKLFFKARDRNQQRVRLSMRSGDRLQSRASCGAAAEQDGNRIANDKVFINGCLNQARIAVPRYAFPGDSVILKSQGNTAVTTKPEKDPGLGRNPKTGTEAPISPHRVIVFKPSAILKQRINSSKPDDVFRNVTLNASDK
jgi:nucleoid DNA-binding protein